MGRHRQIKTSNTDTVMTHAFGVCLRYFAALIILAGFGTNSDASTDSAAKRFLERFETLCLMPVDTTAPALIAGSTAVQQVSARAAEQGFLVNETLFSVADRATLTPFALYLASKGDGLTVMHDLRAVGARINDQTYFTCMFSSTDIAEPDLRAQLDARLGVVQFDNGEMLYPRNGETHRVHLNISEDVGVTLLRQLPLPDPTDTGADQ